jgi:hypothetical protein
LRLLLRLHNTDNIAPPQNHLILYLYLAFPSWLGSGKLLASYYYKDIESLAEVTDYPGGFAVVKADFGRMHLFASEAREDILRRMQEEAANHTGLTLRRKQAEISDRQLRDTWALMPSL